MTENETRKPGLHRADPEDIPPFEAAIAKYRDPERQSLIQILEKSADGEWDPWKTTIEHGRRAGFDSILDFFVNVPSLQGRLSDQSVTGAWLWHPIEPQVLATFFPTRPEIPRLLKLKAGADKVITEGWLLKHDSGQQDIITTWSETSYLIGTDGYFAYIQLSRVHDH